MRRLLLVHGPNLNLLGRRDRSVYGDVTLAEIVEALTFRGREHGWEVLAFQSNHEGQLIDWLQAQAAGADAIIVNPGGLSHHSVSLRDALEDTRRPVVEVHLSNPSLREPFRHSLVTATAAARVIAGKGLEGYLEALEYVVRLGVPDWTREYFERGYGQRWGLLAPSDRVGQEGEALWSLLHLARASRVIDVGCGHGRHALVLAERGADVVGLDFAAALLSRARQLAEELRIPARWIRGDMRRMPFRSECADGAIILDAFGFFDTEAEHEAVLREAARVLTTGGRLALKIVNGGLVLNDFRDTEREERDGVVVSVSNTLTFDPPRLMQKLSVRGSRGHGEYERRQRLYQIDELRAALGRAGFAVNSVFSSPDGAAFEPATSPTIWVVAQRSK
jgi:3-dehydroquinate dehydratase-2